MMQCTFMFALKATTTTTMFVISISEKGDFNFTISSWFNALFINQCKNSLFAFHEGTV